MSCPSEVKAEGNQKCNNRLRFLTLSVKTRNGILIEKFACFSLLALRYCTSEYDGASLRSFLDYMLAGPLQSRSVFSGQAFQQERTVLGASRLHELRKLRGIYFNP